MSSQAQAFFNREFNTWAVATGGGGWEPCSTEGEAQQRANELNRGKGVTR